MAQSRHILLLMLMAAFVVWPTVSFAQQNNSTEQKTSTHEEELKDKAFDLLESLATQTGSLQSSENRARIGSNIVGSIWSHDEKRARSILVSVAEDIRSGLQLTEEGVPKDFRTFEVFIQLRTDTIDRIAKYNPELAFDFLKTTEPPYGKGAGQALEKERAITLRLANQIATTRPDLAVTLAQRSLEQGFPDDLFPLLRLLHRKNREQGIILYKDIVSKIRNTKTKKDFQIWTFARQLSDLRPPLVDEMAFREFVNMVVDIGLANKCDKEEWDEDVNYLCSGVGQIVARVGRIDPARAAKLKTLTEAFESSEESAAPVWSELEELFSAGDYDGALALAEKYPAVADSVYWRAFEMTRRDNLELAKKIADAYSRNPEGQTRMLDQIQRAKERAARTEAQLEDIQKEVERLDEPIRQVEYLITNAVRIGANNRKGAWKLLDLAAEKTEQLKPGREQVSVRVGLAVLYCMEKNGDRGFAIMESLMPKLNELVDAAVKLDGFDTGYVREGEWNMSSKGTLGEMLKWLSDNAAHFAWCDFDRAVNMAAQFDRAEIRMMAQLKLAQGILAGPPKRVDFGGGEY